MKRLAALAAVSLFAGCGLPDSQAAGPAVSESPSIARVGRVVCDEGGTRVLTPRIEAQRDGIHITFINPSGVDEFYMRAAENPTENHGGYLRSQRQRDVSSHSPGAMLVTCFRTGDEPPFYDVDDRYARFEIVDLHDLWVSWEVECSDPTKVEDEAIPGAETEAEALEWFRDRFDLPPGDFQRPGYPETRWKGNPWVLVEDGRTIADANLWKVDGVWTITRGEACRS